MLMWSVSNPMRVWNRYRCVQKRLTQIRLMPQLISRPEPFGI